MQTNINITQSFLDSPDGVMSIHQMSKKLKLPYGTAYNRIHALQKLNIVQILPQGKAKLCALNPGNPMTASLLALGSAQRTEKLISANTQVGEFAKKILETMAEYNDDRILSSILLTPDTPRLISNCKIVLDDENEVTAKEIPFDMFYLTTISNFDDQGIEEKMSMFLPPQVPVKVTSMSVDRATLLGMFTESENEAGLAAYHMLHDGVIVSGFENFFNLVLEAFSKRLTA